MADPRLVITLLVRDEIDVIAAVIEYYAAQLPSAIIVTDNGSIDGTSEVLAEYARAGVIDLINEPSLDYRQSEWVTRMARRAATEHHADWVINADADEFWTARDRSSTLAHEFARVPSSVGVIRAARTDLRYRRAADETEPWVNRLVWRDLRTVSIAGTPLGLKSAHRASASVLVEQGNHGVLGLSETAIQDPGPLDILHVPLRSWRQFEGKIANGGSAYDSNPDLPATMGWHWRSDYERLRAGALQSDVRGRLLGPGDLARGIASGRLRRDTWLRDRLHALREGAVRPDLLAAALERTAPLRPDPEPGAGAAHGRQ